MKVEAMATGTCVVCGASDARLLEQVELGAGGHATLCGSHALMHRRDAGGARSIEELRAVLGERRAGERRALGEGDELAERLSAAFTRERRATERRAG